MSKVTVAARGLTAAAVLVAFLGAVAEASEIVTRRDVVFSEHGSLALDLYRMRGAQNQPVVVLVHGGSWRSGDKSDWDRFAPEFVRAGFLVIVPNYRLAPPGGGTIFPGHLDDLTTALRWTRNNAHRFGGDPRRIGVAGTSAGAHLTLLQAAAGADRPEAVALFSPPIDLEKLHREDVIPDAIESFLGCTPKECPETYEDASPILKLDRRVPPVFLAYSQREVLPVWHGRTLDGRLDRLRVGHRTMELRGSRHGLGVALRVLPDAIDFLRSRLN